ncbi:MAG: hypothetical protein WA733_00590 [Methylocystis sp.]|jgi:hypothetical protein
MSKLKKSGARKWVLGLMAGVSSIAVFASCAPSFAAADAETKAEIRALKEQLKRLEQRLESQAQSQRQTERKVERVEHATVEAPHAPGAPGGFLSKDGVPWPSAFYYKAVTITPGGFFEFATLHRDHYIGADLATPFGNIPYANTDTAHTDETRFTARRSRFILGTDADLDPVTHVKMYLATDFLSDAQTGTLTQSDSWNLRWRELYMKLDRSDFGLHLAAGQMYTLISMNSRGTTPDTFITPPVIDDQYMPGYTWSRQVGIRLSKDLPYNLQYAIAAEMPYTSFGNGTPAISVNGTVGPYPSVGLPGVYLQTPVGGSLYNNANTISFNDVPDLMTKLAWDPDLFGHAVHVEGGGMLRKFDDRVFGGNHDVWGGSGELGVIVSIIPKWLDFQVSAVSGRGNARYGSSDQSIPDVAFNWMGGLTPVHERQAMIGLTAHPTPATDVYVFAGGEFMSATYGWARYPKTAINGGGLYSYGYGNPAYVNTGCNFDSGGVGSSLLSNCVGNTKDVRQVTGGFWHNLYDGPAGKVRVGAQYSYTIRDSFQGVGGAFKGTENMIFTSMRYYPFN